MNKKLGLLFAGVFTAACGLVAAEPVLYTLETSHSFANFELVHQGMSSWRGKFNKMSGRIWLDREAKTGRAEVTIDIKSINTGFPRMDQRAQDEDWFDSAKYPTATYKADSMTFKGDVPAVVKGQLTLRGITKPLSLEIVRFRCAPHPMLKLDQCGGYARGEFDRRDYGMTGSLFQNDGSVRLVIDFEAFLGAIVPEPPTGPPPR